MRPGWGRAQVLQFTSTRSQPKQIRHLNCISTCHVGGKLMDGRTPSLIGRAELACHCLLLQADDALILIDTGLGTKDVADPHSRLSRLFLSLLSPELRGR